MIKHLRKRWVLSAIFLTSLCYFAFNIFPAVPVKMSKDQNLLQVAEYHLKAESILRSLKWHKPEKIDPKNDTNMYVNTIRECQNSLQGKLLLADNAGYVCKRDDIDNSGCCDTRSDETMRYVCDSCKVSNCCSIFEHCVSCCMQPEKKSLLEKIVREASNTLQQMVYLSIHDQFELCLSKCRTSSSSVQHENSYRDPKLKYCFGRYAPELKLN